MKEHENENIIHSERQHSAQGKKARGHGRRMSTPRFILIVMSVSVLIMAAAAVWLDGRHVRFYLTGPRDMTLEYGERYEEPGVYAVSAGKLFGESGRRIPVVTDGAPDPMALGVYEIKYTAGYILHDYSITRTVRVIDSEAPVITLLHSEGYRPDWFTGYEEEGFTALDNHDGDLTDKVERREENGKLIYTVSDSSGNETSVERSPEQGSAPPTLTLYGEGDITVPASMSFSDPGYAACDADGEDVSDRVSVTGEVIPYISGSYRLEYALTNRLGETVSAARTVNVTPISAPDSVSPEGKVIYLTFDDGPGPYTAKLLDLLDSYGVKATFFVTSQDKRYLSLIAREYEEGHSVGVHTCSHNYKDIYSSETAYFSDFNAMEDVIREQTGSYSKLLRFPGGSSNTVSSFNKGIMTRLSKAVTDLGYTYFDWNVSSGDAGETTKTDKVAQNIIDGCSVRNISVVLQHDVKDYSVAAVEKVLVWGITNGYSFLPLEQTSPGVHHSLNN